jgi:acyl-CoA thioester hydrolase
MTAIFQYEHLVTADEIDQLGHVNNLAYLRWMQSAAVAHSDAQGWTTANYLALGAGWVVRSHQIEYRVPALRGHAIVVRTWVADMKKVTSRRRYEIVRQDDGVVLAIAATNWAFIDFATAALKRIPAEVGDCFEIVPDGMTHPQQSGE